MFHHQSQMPSNFAKTMPSTRHAMKAISMFKDDYLLDFINVEELDEQDPQDIDERIIENSIVANVKYKVMPEKLKKILPPDEDFKRLLDGKEINEPEK